MTEKIIHTFELDGQNHVISDDLFLPGLKHKNKNRYYVSGETVVVIIGQFKNVFQYMFLDFSDIELLQKYTVCSSEVSPGHRYAFTYESKITKYFHRIVANTPDDLCVDHINHDTLDNRSQNLRNVTQKINGRNRLVRKDSTTGIKGVSISRRNTPKECYTASLTNDDGKVITKSFTTKKWGSRACDLATSWRKTHESLFGYC